MVPAFAKASPAAETGEFVASAEASLVFGEECKRELAGSKDGEVTQV